MAPTPRTDLGRELYELVKDDSGASSPAIRTKPGLMGLSYVRAEAPIAEHQDSQDEAIAVTVRECIEQATYDLDKRISQREHTDADKGAAARCLLAIEQGTDAMLLWERRTRAALRLRMDVRSMTHQYKQQSMETRLMDALGGKLEGREVNFLARRLDSTGTVPASVVDGSPWLARINDVWLAVKPLEYDLGMLLAHRSTGIAPVEWLHGLSIDTLALFAAFWTLIEPPDEDMPESFVHRNYVPRREDDPVHFLAAIAEWSPFDRSTLGALPDFIREHDRIEPNPNVPDDAAIEILTAHAPLFVAPDVTAVARANDLIASWQRWLNECRCESTPMPLCRAHRLKTALYYYDEALEDCWREVRDPYHSPIGYGVPSARDTLKHYCIRVD